ncbi:MAG: indolepyruvate oxidoreductase subunit beta [Candidatus Omnitrophota bacterium]
MAGKIANIIVAGLGGQGVLKASDIISEAVFLAGFDIKKSEVHGMSQRGGSVCSDIRYGEAVFSPMVPEGEADYLVVLSEDQVENNRHQLREGGVLITPSMIDENKLTNKKSLNVALLGVLSRNMDIDRSFWLDSIRANLPEKIHEVNFQAFEIGRSIGN